MNEKKWFGKVCLLFFVQFLLVTPSSATAGLFDKIYDAQKKAIKAVQKGAEHAGKGVYDEQKKAIAKIQDRLLMRA